LAARNKFLAEFNKSVPGGTATNNCNDQLIRLYRDETDNQNQVHRTTNPPTTASPSQENGTVTATAHSIDIVSAPLNSASQLTVRACAVDKHKLVLVLGHDLRRSQPDRHSTNGSALPARRELSPK
jgi:hypothetical protein